eukprot:6625226-Prymnesium_polylepis.1
MSSRPQQPVTVAASPVFLSPSSRMAEQPPMLSAWRPCQRTTGVSSFSASAPVGTYSAPRLS